MDILPDISLPMWIELFIYILTAICAYIVGKLREVRKRKKEVLKKGNVDWTIHSQIHEFITELRVKTNASRVQVMQFHNGEYFLDGVSMQKMSTTHESLANGLASNAKMSVLITMYAALMERLEENAAILHFVDQEKPSYFKNTLELANVNAYIILPLFNNNGKSGLLMVEWCCEKTDYLSRSVDFVKEEVIHTRVVVQTKLSQQLKDFK